MHDYIIRADPAAGLEALAIALGAWLLLSAAFITAARIVRKAVQRG